MEGEHRALARAENEGRPDVSQRFTFKTSVDQRGTTRKSAKGVLGVPGEVRQARDHGAQDRVAGKTGDDAGHLLGTQFGAPGGEGNLSRQNWIQNRGGGTFYDLERHWTRQLKKGTRIEVEVTDVTRVGEDRPFMRKVVWKETTPDGTVSNHRLDFANADSAKRREAAGVELPKNSGAQVVDLNAYRRKKKGQPQ